MEPSEPAVVGTRLIAGWWLLGGVASGVAVALAVVLLVSAFVGGSAPAVALSAPKFVDEAATAGIDHRYDGPFSFYVGGGVAVFDCDGDRTPDLYAAGGQEPAALYRNDGAPGGALHFSQVASADTDLRDVTGAYPIDIDSDGITDLVVLRFGENVVLRGLGDCRFTRANEIWNIEGGDAWTVAMSAQWEASATLPTLAFGNYAQLDSNRLNVEGCEDHALVRPDGPAYGPPFALSPGYCTLSILFSDWNRSGYRDLRMSNDRHYYLDGEEQLWRIRPGEPPRLYTEADGWNRMQIWGMGIASYDLTGDGRSEVFLTSQGDNKLQTLSGDGDRPRYEDIAFALGATAHRPHQGDATLPSTAWHPEFQDVNNDGYMDLFITKGNVDSQVGFSQEDPNNLLMGNPDGTFVEAAPEVGVDDTGRSRGAALADFNLDGMLDLVVVNRGAPVRIWRNVGAGDAGSPGALGHWIAIDLDQPAPNRDAIGSWVEVRVGDRVQRREVTIGGGHGGGQLGWMSFGLGSATRADIRVTWPDGQVDPWTTVPANAFSIISRDGGVTAWSPASE
ncbi:MAG TPA: CRTAC1 family protein [Acidimicrobiia bacterium]|nr:CRTAC1 family protein [Acidimicrobiia bacterium]